MSDIHDVIVVGSARVRPSGGHSPLGTDPSTSVLDTGDYLIERIDVRQPESQLAHVA